MYLYLAIYHPAHLIEICQRSPVKVEVGRWRDEIPAMSIGGCCPLASALSGLDGACGIGRRLSVSGMGSPLHYLAPVSFGISKHSLILLPGIRCETDIKLFFVVYLSS